MKTKRITKSLLALIMAVTLSIPSFAQSSTTATVPVTLTVSNDYRALNVTVPASLPVYVINGNVITADNAKITNNSKTGSIQVTGITVTDGSYRVGSFDDFSGNNTIALKINDCKTKGSGSMYITETAFPKIKAKGNLPLKYYAKVSSDSMNIHNVQACNVVFTISAAD